MNYYIAVQNAASSSSIPSTKELKQWTKAVLQKKMPRAEITVRIVEKDEMRQLNHTYRHKDKPTNVLSFPFEVPKGVELDVPVLGDIVICADVVKEEALEQGKSEKAHWAHMLVHGILHLLGYDHEDNHDAEIMESEEIVILHSLGFLNPYELTKVSQHE